MGETGSSCFEWIVEHEQTTYEDDGKTKTSDWWEAVLSFSDSYRTISIFNCMHEQDLTDKLVVAKNVRKSMDDFIQALEEAAKRAGLPPKKDHRAVPDAIQSIACVRSYFAKD